MAKSLVSTLLLLAALCTLASCKSAAWRKKKHDPATLGDPKTSLKKNTLNKLMEYLTSDSGGKKSHKEPGIVGKKVADHFHGRENELNNGKTEHKQKLKDEKDVEREHKQKLKDQRPISLTKKRQRLLELMQGKSHHEILEILERMKMSKAYKPDSCTPEYEAMGHDHTMCKYNDSDILKESEPVSESDKQIILDEHNKYRSAADPFAANMEKMYWDDEIAVIAQKWAKTCTSGHDGNRLVPDYADVDIGQNMAAGYKNWEVAIRAWHNEKEKHVYGAENNYELVGHYTQLMKDAAARIGCGYALCDDNRYSHYYVCNYLSGTTTDQGRPYDKGDVPCEDCQDTCSDNLCDCNGKFCMNDGTLNINTCECTCDKYYTGGDCSEEKCPGVTCQNGGTLNADTCKCECIDDFYNAIYPSFYQDLFYGDECENDNCPEEDASWCDGEWMCTTYLEIPIVCPYMCGYCPTK